MIDEVTYDEKNYTLCIHMVVCIYSVESLVLEF